MLADAVNHLWQSTLVAAALALLAVWLRDERARVRYWLWWAASVKFLVPFSLLRLLGGAIAGAPRVELGEWTATLGALAEPMPDAAAWTPAEAALLAVWAAGFALAITAWAVRAAKARALLRACAYHAPAAPHAVKGPEIRIASAAVEPSLVGVLRPVLLLPQGLMDRLSPAQLAAVVEHELAHWRRRDNLTAAVHMLVEAVFWFYPVVRWIGARLVDERERACDEAVVAAGHDRRTYAEAILDVCEHYVASPLKCAAGVSGADLKRRVVEIAGSKVMSDISYAKKALLGGLAFCAVALPIVFGAAAQDDTDLRPLVRIAPEYPPEALQAGREGMVQLEFTITPEGTTRDIVVVESSSPEFEAPAVAALQRWRYMPQPEERRGVHTMIRYQLDRTPAAD